MASLFDIETPSERLNRYVTLKNFRSEAGKLLTEVPHRGEIARGDTPTIKGLKGRTARDLLGSLLRDGILGSESEKGAGVYGFRSMREMYYSLACLGSPHRAQAGSRRLPTLVPTLR